MQEDARITDRAAVATTVADATPRPLALVGQ
jgi:hypothetical protein